MLLEHNVNGSTCGGVHSIGSDMTRIQGQSEANQIGYIHSGQPSHSTPTNKAVVRIKALPLCCIISAPSILPSIANTCNSCSLLLLWRAEQLEKRPNAGPLTGETTLTPHKTSDCGSLVWYVTEIYYYIWEISFEVLQWCFGV